MIYRSNSTFATAIFIHCCFMAIGWLIGRGLDELVWFLSHDYVFPPDLFASRALMISWLAASFVVCFLAWNGRLLIPPRTVLQLTTTSLFLLLLTFVAAMTLVVASTTKGWPLPIANSVNPRRHQISIAIPYAGSVAAILGCSAFVYSSCRQCVEK